MKTPLQILTLLVFLLVIESRSFCQTVVFADDFSSNTNANWSTSGIIDNWSVTRNAADWGARRNTSSEQLQFTNNTDNAITNADGYVYASLATSNYIGVVYQNVLKNNPGLVTWSFNMNQNNADPEGVGSSNGFGTAFILATNEGGTGINAFQGTGTASGYAVVLGQPGTIDNVRLVRFENGISNTTNIVAGTTDYSTEYLSIKVVYNPCNNEWNLYLRNDAGTFVNPLSGSLNYQGASTDATFTSTSLGYMGAYFQGASDSTYYANFDNVAVSVEEAFTPITGTTSICEGTSTTLSNATTGGTWSSSNTSIATINATTGAISGLAVGNTTVTYTFNDCSVTSYFVVNPVPSSIIGPTSLCVGATTILSDTTAGGTWASSNTAIATIDASGLVTGIAVGTTTITYLKGTCLVSTTLTVNTMPKTITGNTSICLGSTSTLSCTPSGGIWSSNNTSIATVNAAGVVTAKALGTCTISYSKGSCISTATISVITTPADISGENDICIGTTTDLDCITTDGIWSSLHPSIASVNASTGAVLGISSGIDTIRYTNQCGYKDFAVTVHAKTTTWTGAVSTDWDDNANWTDLVPIACTDVIIPEIGDTVQYPIIGATGICHYITFLPGAAVLGLKKLTYERAYVHTELQRSKWYTLTAPLKNMYSGDYYFSGSPVSYMRLFDAVNPDSTSTGSVSSQTWTRTFANLTVNLTPGMGYAYMVAPTEWHYPTGRSTVTTNKTIVFPRMNADSSLISKYIYYSSMNGYQYTNKYASVSKDASIAYRFAMEDASGVLQNVNVPISTGLNLVGNPMMTHLDFNALYNSNVGKISNKVKFWNGSTFTTYMIGSQIASDMDLTSTSIPPMQSFIVEGLASSSMLIDLDAHFIVDMKTKLKAASTPQNVMHIKTSMGSLKSSTAIGMNTNANNGFGEEDAIKLFTPVTEVPDVYTLADNKALDINQFKTLPYTVPLKIRTTSKGNISYHFDGAESFENINVYLIDKKKNIRQNLKGNNEFVLNYINDESDNSLYLEFTKDGTENSSSNCSDCIQIILKDGRIINITSKAGDEIKEVTVSEQNGKILYKKTNIGLENFNIDLRTNNPLYVVSVKTKNNSRVVKLMSNNRR